MTTSVTRKKLPLRCPACDAPLRVSKMICGRCATEVSGEFELPVLTSLNEEEQRFMLEFVGYGKKDGGKLSYCAQLFR